ncbi:MULTISPECIES: TRAP transporter large permease [Brevibacterium]|uniref:TRAP C4-dicarboxylate transport system permease DctM n=1 Tax=Brevibacterium casei S18 TaxID=1229781 RepID=K9AHD9_9MICO|nr:TRAP transporter large permease [Brevibacterium casei]NJE67397.1 TRAP transporter large permease [Brevibacterium sp. LS14]EKU45496.1 TRAP C4-dicarboxylate transport system permease DctM [Brevibacterium casei S18]MCT1446036.1 TRAP transporter large permease [Brevibacterium casei]MCT1764508.1 TRAP transporter large permease [Brevibacterium casei]QZE25379.1 TRAP transporter large permease [Brevibacterium casei]
MTLLLMLLALLILLALRVPVGIALLVPSIIYIAFDPSSSPALAVQQATSGVFDFAILAVPMFILLGNLANISGATDRLYDAAVAAIGHVRGSLGYVNILTSFGFSWVSGAAISDAAAMGRIQVPAMIRRGYPVGFSLGVTGASSLIAPMMPPSIPAIIYAVTAGVSVGALFVAGIVPAVLLVVTLSVMCWFLTRKREDLRLPKAGLGERVRSGLRALPPVGAAVVILGGILSGVFTPTEASAVGVAYIGILAIVYGNFTWPKVRHALVTAVETTGGVLIIVAGAALFGWVLAREQAPQLAADVLLSITDRPIVFLILVPVLLPVAEVFGLSPVHFGIMIIFNLLIGLLTPPVGLVLFVLSSVTKYPVTTVIKGTLPFFVPMLATLVLISVVPFLSLWLPSLLGYPV